MTLRVRGHESLPVAMGAVSLPITSERMKDHRALSGPQRRLLVQIAGGARLKDHRDIEGGKRYTLTVDTADAIMVEAHKVEGLVERGLIDSNKKFPSATYWLTEAGKRVAAGMAADRHGPLNT